MLKFILLTLVDESPVIVNTSDIACVWPNGEHTEVIDFNGEAINVIDKVPDIYAMLQQ